MSLSVMSADPLLQTTYIEKDHHDTLRRLHGYAAGPNLLTSLGWQRQKGGHQVVEKPAGLPVVLILVGRVADDGMRCGPIGNLSSYNTLATSKFQFTLSRPDNTAFASDFDKAIDTLLKLQKTIASTDIQRNLICVDKAEKYLRFTSPMFQQRVGTITLHGHNCVV